MDNLEQFSDQELEDEQHRLQDERAALKDRARAVADELDRRNAVKFAATLSPEQKAQVLAAASVDSRESVNGG